MRVRLFSPPRPAVPGEAQVLQISKGEARHQRVAMQPRPGTTLEAAESQFLLEPLLAYPTRLDSGCQGA